MSFGVVTTRRLELRPIQEGDEHLINPAIRGSMASLRPWVAWAAKTPTLGETRAYVRRKLVEWDDDTQFAFVGCLRRDGRFALLAEIWVVDKDVPSYEIGYWCRQSLQGQGLMVEAVKALTRECFAVRNARRIQIRADAHNKPSQKVAMRAGFQFEGRLRQCQVTAKGALRDTVYFSRIRRV